MYTAFIICVILVVIVLGFFCFYPYIKDDYIKSNNNKDKNKFFSGVIQERFKDLYYTQNGNISYRSLINVGICIDPLYNRKNEIPYSNSYDRIKFRVGDYAFDGSSISLYTGYNGHSLDPDNPDYAKEEDAQTIIFKGYMFSIITPKRYQYKTTFFNRRMMTIHTEEDRNKVCSGIEFVDEDYKCFSDCETFPEEINPETVNNAVSLKSKYSERIAAISYMNNTIYILFDLNWREAFDTSDKNSWPEKERKLNNIIDYFYEVGCVLTK